jgi:hypothetical protein
LGDIDPFTLIVPEINRSRFRIGPLTKEDALMAANVPLEAAKAYVDKRLIDKLVDEDM